MTIQQLRAFTTVAQLENISKAADFLHISQSSLSKQISKLESELGVTLFDRKGKKITLNKAGMAFYDSGSKILRELHTAEDNLKFLSRNQKHHIRIGMCSLPDDFLNCMTLFAQNHPETEYVLHNRIEFQKHSDINEYDALICPEDYKYEKLNGYHLVDDGYYFAVPAKKEFFGEKTFSSRMLAENPVVFLQGDTLEPEFPYRICTALGVDMKCVYFTDTRETHRKMIAAGAACGFVPKTEEAAYSQDKNIRLLHVLDKRFVRPMKICFLREKHLSELGMQFREYVMDYYHLEPKDAEESEITDVKKSEENE